MGRKVGIRDVELKSAMLDAGSLLNVIPLSIIEAARVCRDKIFKQAIEVADLASTSIFTLGSIDLKLNVWPIKMVNRFHFVARPSTLFLLGKSWIHILKMSPPPTTNSEGHLEGKES